MIDSSFAIRPRPPLRPRPLLSDSVRVRLRVMIRVENLLLQ